MRAGRWLVVVLALLGGAAALAGSDVPTTTTIHYAPIASISDRQMRAELLAVRASLESADSVLVHGRSVAPGETRVILTESVVLGDCVTVVAAAAGHKRVRHIEWLPRGSSAWRPEPVERRASPYRRFVAQTACPMRATASSSQSDLQFDVRFDGDDGQAEVMVLIGPPGPPLPDAAEILEDRVVERDATWTPAIANALVAAFGLLLIGVMIESALHTRRDRRDRERTLRRITIALPSGLRGVLESIASSPSVDAPCARALRDQLVSLAPLAHAAVLQRWRDDPDVVDARRDALREELTRRRPRAKQSGYRAAGEGLFAITLLIRHRCELPELPARLDAAHLASALESSLPRHDGELIDVEVVWHPGERVEALDRAQLEPLFPELVPIASGADATCASCEAPVRGDPARCPACGQGYQPRAVDSPGGRVQARPHDGP